MNSFIKRITFLSLIPLLAIGGFFINENPSLIFANVPYHIILYTAEGSYKVDGVDGVDGLDGVQSVAVSPGGNHVYAAAETDDAVTVFTRNSSTGALSFVEMKKDGVGGVDGLNAAQSVTVSPGGNHVYAVGRDDNAVAVFSRNLSTGALTYVEVKKDGAGGVDGLYGAKSVTVSPDGKHLYTAAEGDHAVAVFSINSSTGALTYVEVKKDGAGGVDGIAGAQAVTVSPDGKHVYAASDSDNAIAVFSRNSSTGALTYVEMKKDGVGGVDGLDNAKSVTLSPDGMHLYATSWNDEAISVFSRNSTTGALTYVEMQKAEVGTSIGLRHAKGVDVSPDGKHVYVTGYGDDKLVVFGRNSSTGALTWLGAMGNVTEVKSVAVSSDGKHVYAAGSNYVTGLSRGSGQIPAPTNVTLTSNGTLSWDPPIGLPDWSTLKTEPSGATTGGLNNPHSVAVSPDGNHVYVTGFYDDAVAVFSRNSSNGVLTYIEAKKDGVDGVDGLDGAWSVTVSPDGKHVYAAGVNDDSVALFSRNSSTGTLTYVEIKKDGVDGVDGLDWVRTVTVSPDGNHLYAGSRYDNAVAVFSRNSSTGKLTYVEVQKDGVDGVDGLGAVRSVAVSLDGKHVYTAAEDDHAVAVFSRNSSTGALTYVEMKKDGVGGVDGLDRAQSATVSPDGNHVYAASDSDDAIAVFSRNSSTGALTYVEMKKDGVGGVDGLDGAKTVTVSPDGNHVYANGYDDDAVAVFSRNSSTGALTYVEVKKDGVGGVNGIGLARGITVSPDGNHLYVSGYSEDAIVTFTRNSSTGALTFVEMKKNGFGIGWARQVTVSPDGKHVYIADYTDDAVLVLSRNSSTGALTHVERKIDGVGGVDGLDGADSVTVSPDGSHVYAGGWEENAISVFSRNSSTGALTYVEVKKDGVGGVDGISDVELIAVSPDGKHVYAVGRHDGAVAVFSRNLSTGALTYVEMKKDGVGGVDGLDDATSVTLSPDARHLYATSWDDNAISVFSRNSTTGALTYVEIKQDGVGGVDGLTGANSVAVSSDGKHVYAAGATDGAISVFSRNSSTGALTFVEVQKDGVNGVGLSDVRAVTLSPSGNQVFAASRGEGEIRVYSRNSSTGALTYAGRQPGKLDGIRGLYYTETVVVSPDGSHVYSAGSAEKDVAVFSRNISATVTEYTIKHLNGTEVTLPYSNPLGNGALTWNTEGNNYYRYNTVVPISDDCTSYSYTVEVSGYSVGGTTSTASNLVSNPATYKNGPAPQSPSNVTAGGGDGTAVVSWDKPFSYSGCPTTYTITYDGKTQTSTDTPVQVEGLTNGNIYRFKVSAGNEFGSNTAKNSAWTIPDSPVTIPDQPINVSAVAGEGSTFLSWDPPVFDGLSEIYLYTVKTYPEGAGRTHTTPNTEIEITGLKNGAQYVFTVQATNKAGTGYESEASNTVTPATIPNAPENVVGVRGDSEVVVSWSPPDFDGGTEIINYSVTSEPGYISHNTEDTSFRFTELSNGTEYTFSVLATNDVGSSSSSGISNGVTPATYPGSPREVIAETSNGKALVAWSPPEHDGGNAITNYLITSYPGEIEKTVQEHFGTIEGLTNGIEYTFKVSAANEVGIGNESLSSNSIIPLSVPGQPVEVIAMAGDSEVTVSWSSPDFDGGIEITNYIVTSPDGLIRVETKSNSISILGLTSGTEYTFTVVAENLIGTSSESEYSNPVTLAAVPEAPLNTIAPTTTLQYPDLLTVVDLGTRGYGGSYEINESYNGQPMWTNFICGPPGQNEHCHIFLSPSKVVSSTGTWVIQPVPPTDEWNAGGYFDCPGLPWESCSPGWEGVEITVSKASGDQSSDKAIESESSTDPVAPMTLPGTPVDITIESEGSGALISWSPPISNGGSQITGYTITSSVGDISVTTEETSILIEGLNDEIEYTFLVTANNSIGAGEQSGISGKFSLPEAAEPTVSTSTVPVVTSTETQPTSVNTVPEPTDNAVPRTSDPRPSSLVGRAVGDTGDSSSNMPLILIGIVIGSIVVIALGLQGYRRIRSS